MLSHLTTAPAFMKWIAMNIRANNLQECTWKGLRDTWHLCVCGVYVCVWIRSTGGPLFSVGPSNPFKSALLIPLSSHSCRGFLQSDKHSQLSVCKQQGFYSQNYCMNNFQFLTKEQRPFFGNYCLCLIKTETVRRLISVSSLCIHSTG